MENKNQRLKVWNKTGSNSIIFKLAEIEDNMKVMSIMAKAGYHCVLFGEDKEETDGYKNND